VELLTLKGGLGTYSLAFRLKDTFVVGEVVGVLEVPTCAYSGAYLEEAYLMASSVQDESIVYESAFPLKDDSYELVSAFPCLEVCGDPRIVLGKRNHFLAEYTYYHFHP